MALLLLDGLPASSAGHKRLKRAFAPLLETFGLAQGSWQLFAPEPDSMNVWVEARVQMNDGSQWVLRSPDWQKRSLLEKFHQARLPKLWDLARLDNHRKLWPHLADYAARIAPRPGPEVRPRSVELVRHYWSVPPPKKMAAERERYSSVPPPQDEFGNQYSYFTKVIH